MTQHTRRQTDNATNKPRSWAAPKRVVLKFGTNLLTGGRDALDEDVIRSLVGQVADIRRSGIEVVVVTSGAVAAGKQALAQTPHKERLQARAVVSYRQTLAALGQARLMGVYARMFAEHGTVVAQALISRGDIQLRAGQRRAGYLNVQGALHALLQVGAVPVINENDVVAVEEIEGEVYGDNDRLSAMVANLVDADLLVLLGEMEGLFTADPHLDPEALVIPVVDEITADIERRARGPLDGRGRGGMASKVEAAKLATASGADVVIASGKTKQVITRICRGEEIGTRFAARATGVESRKRWLLTGVTDSRGAVDVDAGAAKALLEGGRSLLPAGVTGVDGKFERGDLIVVRGPDGRMIASGLANYGAKEVASIKGKKSGDVGAVLGYEFGPEVIHRNNMALV